MKKKIFFICNRYTANQDIIEKMFGRQISFAQGISSKNYEVILYCADYKKKESFEVKKDNITIISSKLSIQSAFGFLVDVIKTSSLKNPDIIIGGSVPLWGFLGYFIAKLQRKKYIYDIQDNYEIINSSPGSIISYVLHRINLLLIHNVMVVSDTLKQKYKNNKRNILVAPNGINLQVFKKLDQKICREKWEFDDRVNYIGYCGSLAKNRGIMQLQEAFLLLHRKNKNIKLILAGGINDIKIIKHPNITYLGNVSPEKVPSLLNALDVIAIPNPENEFTKYCFPYKILEAMACGKKIITSKSGVLKSFNLPENYYWKNTQDIEELAEKLQEQLTATKIANYDYVLSQYSNEAIADKLDTYFYLLLRKKVAIICDNIDADKLTGTANYALQLVNHVKSNKEIEYTIVHKKSNKRLDLQYNKELIIKDTSFPLYSTFRKIFLMPFILIRNKFDLVHETYQMGPFILPFLPFKKVVTIHDIFFKTNPQTHGFMSKMRHNISLPIILRHINFIITDSKHSKKDILRYFKVDPKIISVIYLGVETPNKVDSVQLKKIKQKYDLPDKFILTICSIEPRKNIRGSIEAVQNVIKQGNDIFYVLVGKKTYPYFKELQHYCKEHNLTKNIIFLDYVPYEDLPYVYSLAYVFLFPSFYEGFGLPVLEAMSYGCPVITSNVSSIPEVAGNNALLINPRETKTIEQAIMKIYSDMKLHKELIDKGLRNVLGFAWPTCAHETETVYKNVLNL